MAGWYFLQVHFFKARGRVFQTENFDELQETRDFWGHGKLDKVGGDD